MMMNLENILEVMDKFDASRSTYMELEMGDVKLKLKKEGAYQVAAESPVFAENMPSEEQKDGQLEGVYITAPLVGVFYAAASPEKKPFVEIGQRVEKGDTVCLIEAMKMMSEVTADKAGVIREIMAENGELVEYGEPLFRIEE